MLPLLTIPAPSSIQASPSLHQRVFNRDGYTCVYCGMTGVSLELDHLRPLAHFSTTARPATVNDPRNLVAACGDCNGSKGPQDLAGFLRMLRGRGVPAKDVAAMVRRVRAATRRRLPLPLPL